MLIVADSQCFTYLFDALEGVSEPTDILADQKKALLRCFLYLPGCLCATPGVIDECANIPDAPRRDMHKSYFDPLFDVLEVSDTSCASSIAGDLSKYHSGQADCRIVSEAIVGGADVFLTFDLELKRRLAERCGRLRILTPAEYWSGLAIAPGAQPRIVPSSGRLVAGKYHEPNPLASQTWWRW